MSQRKLTVAAAACLLTLSLSGCMRYAVNRVGDALARTGTTFASDNDPDFVGEAVPFGLKLIESLLAENPRHRGLLLAAASGFTQYAYAFLQQPADELEPQDLDKATALRTRARKMYLRARDYGLRGLSLARAGFESELRRDPKAAVRAIGRRDVPLLYWTAAAWGSAIALSKDNPELVADQPLVEALIDRALEVDEGFEHGAVHSFLISYEPSRKGAAGDPYERSRKHFERAMELSEGRLAGPLVAYAETVALARQDRKEFEALLRRALEIDPDARPEFRLANLIVQRRARWLLSRLDELFLE
ncbi:MAG: TRAP transporter TatT component family protein [Bryobacterales bacterium]|nr:TRAP transporter TatT component family protein [Bryobacteraceae bacterium]MDW8354222.1 TRAP transporter TatT component family protein [Bryobacterales bacterium]